MAEQAKMLVYTVDGGEMVFPVEVGTLQTGDLILLESSGVIPADTKILTGQIQLSDGRCLKQGDIAPRQEVVESGQAKGYVIINQIEEK